MLHLTYRAKLALTLMSFAGFILSLAFFSVTSLLQNKQMDKALIEAENIYHEKKKLFFSHLHDIDSILFAIERSPLFEAYLKDPSAENLKHVNEMFLMLSCSNKRVMQLRYINKEGLEVIRVNRPDFSSDPVLVPSDHLQDKQLRYYFTAIINGRKDAVWYSKIDLNQENGNLELQPKPVLRGGIPLKEEGILVVNIFMKEFLNNFISSSSSHDLYLVDHDGYILVSSDHKNDWSRYLGTRKKIQEITAGKKFYEKEIEFENEEGLRLCFLPKERAIYSLLFDEKKSILFSMVVILLLGIPLSYFFSLHPAKLENELVDKNTHLQEKIDDAQKQQELITSIINSADDMIFYKDADSVYLGFNNAYQKWLNLPKNKIIGHRDIDFYPEAVASDHLRADRYVLKNNATIVIEEKFERENSDTIILQVKKSPFYNNDGDVIGLVVVARDVTRHKKMESELLELNTVLEQRVAEKTYELQKSNDSLEENIENLQELNRRLLIAKEEAQQAAQARSNFISSISHELRTPLNSIINFTDQVIEDFDEMLDDEELQRDTQMYLGRVLENSRHLLQLINDLLEFTKAEVGKMDYQIKAHDINEILKIAYNNTFSLLNGTDVAFRLSLSETPLRGMIDSRRFLQIILNLLSNAIKFTNSGFIEIRSFTEGASIVVEIEDTGKGIPAEKNKLIFEPFMQVLSTDNGTGLGLGLAKKMCDDMGIEITFTSAVGVGTVFRLALAEKRSV